MSEHDDRPDPDGLEDRAAQVTDYLVAVRGGAPFLSGADGRLLLAWLDRDVPVPAILAAIDQVAARRRKKRVRSRLTLTACRRSVDKLVAAAAGVAAGGPSAAGACAGGATARPAAAGASPQASPDGVGPLAAFRSALAEVEVHSDLRPALDRLRAELDALSTRDLHPDALGRAAARALTGFHAAAWDAAQPRHGQLRARAEAQLEPLRASIPAASWPDMVDEVARDLLRQEYPAVSARRLWDSLGT